jgi:hypothetical protein
LDENKNKICQQMKYQTFTLLMLLLLSGKISTAQTLTGDWKGTSTCQVKNSPCHDEVDVYHISKGKESNSYIIDAGRISEGKEVDMGILNFLFDQKQNLLTSGEGGVHMKWIFKVAGDTMHGTLTQNGQLYRIIDLKKIE